MELWSYGVKPNAWLQNGNDDHQAAKWYAVNKLSLKGYAY